MQHFLAMRLAERIERMIGRQDWANRTARSGSGVQQAHKEDRITFTALTGLPGTYISAEATFMEGDTQRRAGVIIGPEFGTVRRPAPSRDAHRPPALPPRWSQRGILLPTVARPVPTTALGGLCARPYFWHQATSHRTSTTPVSFRPDRNSREGSLPSWGRLKPAGSSR